MIYIPQDLEILQFLYQKDSDYLSATRRYDPATNNYRSSKDADFKILEPLLNRLSFQQIVYLYMMLTSLYEVIRTRLSMLEASSELPTGDDHLMDFCSYCLSLPRERIYNLIKDPCNELIQYRLYYVPLTGEGTYEFEEYLIGEIENYLEKKYGIEDILSPEYEEAIIFLNSYQDILLKVITIPESKVYEKGCHGDIIKNF